MKALTYKLKLLEPLLATQTQSDEPNSSVTYPFIPGSMMRGALIGAWLKEKNLLELNPGSDDIRDMFFNGKTQFLNAYLAHPIDDSRSLPRPLSWLVPKDETDMAKTIIYDFAIESLTSDDPFKPPANGDFCWAKNGTVHLDNPKLQITVHNASDDPDYKAEGKSQVYRYDALASGQVFAGVILTEDETNLELFKSLLEAYNFNLGGSITGGYGAVEIFDVQIPNQWQEYQEDAFAGEEDEDDGYDNLPEDSLVVLTCLSDVIVRDETGACTTDLAAFINCETEMLPFYKTRIVGGFNRTWGLPLEQAIVIEAGSVFVFPVACYANLKDLVEKGIGERRAEGFGRIAVNWHCRPTVLKEETAYQKSNVQPPQTLSADSLRLAQQMAKRQLKAKVDVALTKVVNDYSGKLTHLPSASQLSNARQAATRAWRDKSLAPISDYFSGLKKFTRREWEETRLAGEKFIPWLTKLLENGADFQLDFGEPPVVAGETADFNELRVETITRLVEGVLRRAEKQVKEKAAQGGQHG